MTDKNRLKMEVFFMSFLLLAIILGLFIYFEPASTGKVILTMETSYSPNSTLNGGLSLSLKPGELIPGDSIVSINFFNQSRKYVLSDLVEGNLVEGNFYGEGLALEGKGLGYGVPGNKEVFPEVSFTMVITSNSNKKNSVESNSPETDIESSGLTGNIVEETETIKKNNTNGVIRGGNVIEETPAKKTTGNVTEQSEEESKEEPKSIENTETEEEPSEILEEPSEILEEPSEILEEPSEILEEPSEILEEPSEILEEPSEILEEPKSIENTDTEEEPNVAPITGNVVAKFDLGNLNTIVKKDSPFIYELKEGQTAKIISSDQPVSLTIDKNIVTVTTNYSELETRFGESYLGEEFSYFLNINISSLNLDVGEGDFSIDISHGENEIVSVSTFLSIENPEQVNEVATQTTEKSESISDFVLSVDEEFALISKTKTTIPEITKAISVDDRLIIKFEIGNYWLENSYDYSRDELDLKNQIEIDRAKFAKRLARSMLEEEINITDISGYLGTNRLVEFEDETESGKEVE